MWCAANLGLAGKGKGAFLQRGMSGRKAARSDYEEQQVVLGLKAVEKMKQMVLVSPSSCPCSQAGQSQSRRSSLNLKSHREAILCVHGTAHVSLCMQISF